MDIEIGIKLIAIILAAIGIFWRYIYQVKGWKKSQYREEYEFSKKFLKEVKDIKLHPYSKEKGYHAIAGTEAVKGEEIEYILSLEKPVRCLKDYILSKQLMKELNIEGNLKIEFKKKYAGKWSRIWRKGIYITAYFLSAVFIFSPFILHSDSKANFSEMISQLVFTVPFGSLYAWIALYSLSKIIRGENLVKNQKSHTKRVISGTKTGTPTIPVS
ncbi:MAG: hypothetical protein ABW139_07550 [Candidatus Thiodiazotropha sp. DIVDIV]